jgi:hypothetical protein
MCEPVRGFVVLDYLILSGRVLQGSSVFRFAIKC